MQHKTNNRKLLIAVSVTLCLSTVFARTNTVKAVEKPLPLVLQNNETKLLTENAQEIYSLLPMNGMLKTQEAFLPMVTPQPIIEDDKSSDLIPHEIVDEENHPILEDESRRPEKEFLFSNGYVRVRDDNSGKGAEKCLLKPGQKIEVLKDTEKFVKVKTEDKKIGYVVKKNLLSESKKSAMKIAEKKAKKFRITGYCPCRRCSEGYGRSTKSGRKATANRTVAADLSILSMYTNIYIEGIGQRTVEDVGGQVKGNHIDVFVNEHYQCSSVTRSANIFVLEG